MVAISELLQGCLIQFISIANSDALSDHTEKVPLQGWTDELGRLRVWAANIGAHQTRQSSLDYRLRDASHIKGQIVRLLERCRELLTDLKDVLEESDGDAQEDGLEDFEGLEDISEREDSTTEIQEIHQCLIETITQLYQMSMIIRQPAQHDRLVGTKKLDSEPFQFWAKQHTSSKYPNADALAIDRISSAMARQRAILKYRERHHAKLSQGIDSEGDGKSIILSETVITDVFQEIAGQSSDTAFDAAVSETSYGGTLLEGTGADAPKIPSIPKKGREQRPFECPFCFYIITAREKKAWARHIFRDLMPYVCIFPGCSTPNKLYGGRRQWHHHIQQAHAPKSGPGATYDCPICKQGPLPSTTFQRHVGQHLEELALFLLPRTESDDDEEAATDDELSNASLDDNSVERGGEQRNDMNNAAKPASDSDPGNENILERPRNQSKHYTSSVGTNESDKTSPTGDLETNVEDEIRASSSLGSRENEPAEGQEPSEKIHAEESIEPRKQLQGPKLPERELEERRGPLSSSKHSKEDDGPAERKRLRERVKRFLEEVGPEEWKERAGFDLKMLARASEGFQDCQKLVTEIIEDRSKEAEIEEKRRKEAAMKAAAVEEWKVEQGRIKQTEPERKEKEFRERLSAMGYNNEEIENITHKQKEKDDGLEKKTTWIKVHRKHLLPETLLAFNLPWDWDERDSNYIIIKKWIDEDFQEELFAHTRRLREEKVVEQTSSSATELKVNDRTKDKMFLVRKKAPNSRVIFE